MSYYEDKKKELQNLIAQYAALKTDGQKIAERLVNERAQIEKDRTAIVHMAKERQQGFPWLARAYEEYFLLQDRILIDFLKYKKTPAISASEIVKELTRIRRETIKKLKVAEYVLTYYESIFPFLIELKEEVVDIGSDDRSVFEDYSEEELQDPAVKYLTKEEFRKLPSIERNQLALDRFWKRPKSKWLIGRIYERYVGYLYENQGYDVEYAGIFRGYEDLGRDLICQKENDFVVIQCKYWAQFRTIYEKHIFQFFGTVFQYRDANPTHKVRAVFHTSTALSDLARRFATELGIELQENFKFDQNYPSIKCNVSRVDGSKIYHLPFDQQYDNVKIEKSRGEFYCRTVKEAEEAEFRRAFRWKGKKE